MAIPKKTVTGLNDILKNLSIKEDMIAKGLEQGVKRSALILYSESQKLVPVDTGNLKANSRVRLVRGGRKASAVIEYLQNYAMFVHENLDALHGADYNAAYSDVEGEKLRGPRQQAKFIETPAKDTGVRKRMSDAVASSIKRQAKL